MAPILFNGQQYDSVETMPPDVRAAYEAVVQAFADKNQDGVPDIFQGAGAVPQMRMMTHASTSYAVNGQTYTSLDEMPADVRAAYEQALSAAGMASAGRSAPAVTMSAFSAPAMPAAPPSAGGLRTTDVDPVIKAGPAGMGMLWLGIFVIMGLFAGVIILASDSGERLLAPFFPDRVVPEWGAIAGYLIVFIPATVLMMGAMLWLIRRTTGNDPALERELAESGENAEAVVIRLSDTGTTINKSPLVKLLLEVRPRTRPAYRAETQLLISRLSISQVQPGAVLRVRISPDDPRKLIFVDQA